MEEIVGEYGIMIEYYYAELLNVTFKVLRWEGACYHVILPSR